MAENVEPLEAQARRAVGRVFATLKTSFPAWYEKHYGEKRAETIARRVWMTGIRELSDEQVDRGLRRMVLEREYPPSLVEFVRLCRKVDGVPDVATAWHQALEGRYSHDAVKVAAAQTGLYELRRATLSDKALRAEFEHCYGVVLGRLERGEPLDGRIHKALPGGRSPIQAQHAHSHREARDLIASQGLPTDPKQARALLLAKMGIRRPEASA